MKSIKFFVTAAMLAVSMSASAQFINDGPSSSSSSTTDTNGWGTVWVEYNPSTLKFDFGVASADKSFTGLSAGYSVAFNVMQGKPLFVEAGLGLQYSFYSDDAKFSMFSLKVPVNLLYKFDIPNTSIALMPYVGLNLRGNLVAELGKADLFDKKDMGSDDATWNRFQVGWQIGAKARFGKNIQVGLSYGSDFSEIAEKTKISTVTISLGYAF